MVLPSEYGVSRGHCLGSERPRTHVKHIYRHVQSMQFPPLPNNRDIFWRYFDLRTYVTTSGQIDQEGHASQKCHE